MNDNSIKSLIKRLIDHLQLSPTAAMALLKRITEALYSETQRYEDADTLLFGKKYEIIAANQKEMTEYE